MQRHRIPTSRRGSLLVVAMLLAAITAISIVSYLQLGTTSMQLAHRAFLENAAMNLAESGLEQAMWSIDQKRTGNTNAWQNWVISGTSASSMFNADGVHVSSQSEASAIGLSATGVVRVYVDQYLGALPPIVTARATVIPASGAPIEKWVQVQVHKRSLFANGLVAKNSITFNGNNSSVDSWVSDTDGDNNPLTGAPVAYDPSIKTDHGTAASISVAVNSVLVKQADIWGYVSTGGADPTSGVGSNGSILGVDSPVGVKVDPNRVSTDFTYNFSEVIADPVTKSSLGTINSSTTITSSGSYPVTSINLASHENLNIGDATHHVNVVLVISGSSAISTTGNAGINVADGSTLKVFTAGDIKIAGNGLFNGNSNPASIQIYGSSSSTPPSIAQDLQIAGNGNLVAVVYAPNASVKINGNGAVMGSIVGNDITLVGNAAFHYDESLMNLGGGPYGITGWQELTTAAQRNAMQSYLNF